jgi:hypothetical protein
MIHWRAPRSAPIGHSADMALYRIVGLIASSPPSSSQHLCLPSSPEHQGVSGLCSAGSVLCWLIS